MNVQFFHLCRAVPCAGERGVRGPRYMLGTVVMPLSRSPFAAKPNVE